jgi:hypothetical protein
MKRELHCGNDGFPQFLAWEMNGIDRLSVVKKKVQYSTNIRNLGKEERSICWRQSRKM